MRNNNIKVSPAMQECLALLKFLCNHAGFKIVQGSFCVFLDVLDLVLVMHVNSVSP